MDNDEELENQDEESDENGDEGQDDEDGIDEGADDSGADDSEAGNEEDDSKQKEENKKEKDKEDKEKEKNKKEKEGSGKKGGSQLALKKIKCPQCHQLLEPASYGSTFLRMVLNKIIGYPSVSTIQRFICTNKKCKNYHPRTGITFSDGLKLKKHKNIFHVIK